MIAFWLHTELIITTLLMTLLKKRKIPYIKNVALCEVEQILTNTSQAINEVQKMQKKVQIKNDKSITRLDQTFEDIAAIMQSRKQIVL